MIVDAFRSGKPMRLANLKEIISEMTGREIKVTDISSLVTKIVKATELGHFIKTQKINKANAYILVKDVLDLEPEEMYGLSRKTGQDRFTVEAAVEKYPALQKHVKKDSIGKSGEKKKSKVKVPLRIETPEKKKAAKDQGQPTLINLVWELVENGLRIEVNMNVRVY